MYNEDELTLVLDNGSGSCKLGFSGDDTPRVVMDNIAGRPRPHGNDSKNRVERVIGDQAQKMRDILSLRYPMTHGVITDWDDMELIWDHLFKDELSIETAGAAILVTDALLNPPSCREKLGELFYEKYNFDAMDIRIQDILALYSSGRTTGCVVNVGDGVSSAYPIWEGYNQPMAFERLDFGGRDLTEMLQANLVERGYPLATTAGREIAKEIKEKVCFNSLDFFDDFYKISKNPKVDYVLPDGEEISLKELKITIPEGIFSMNQAGFNEKGLHMYVHDCIMRSNIDCRKDLFSNIVAAGGGTKFKGFENRLEQELKAMVPHSMEVRVNCDSEREFAAWIGGSILSSLSTFQNMWCTREEYDDFGGNLFDSKQYAQSSDCE